MNVSLDSLIKYADRLERNLKDVKSQIVSRTNDFDTWRKYSADKVRYEYLLGINTKIRETLDKGGAVKDYRYLEVDIDFLLNLADVLIETGIYNTKDKEELQQEIMKLNFGSMIINW